MKRTLKLGVNIDHVATLRQARLGKFPSPEYAAKVCEQAGADGITAHLREDRRHIQDADMENLVRTVKRLNMEMAVTDEMVAIASRLRPANCCLVPEKRQELTTEGGLDAAGSLPKLTGAVKTLKDAGITVSIFIDPVEAQKKELERLIKGAEFAHSLGLTVNAGHGIDYENIQLMLKVPYLHELNIGYSIICRAIFTGLKHAVQEMLSNLNAYGKNGEN